MSTITCLDLSRPRKSIINFYDDAAIRYKAMPTKKQEQIKTIVKLTESALIISFVVTNPTKAFALETDIAAKVKHALDPIVDLIQALGYPIAVISMSGGAITMMFNKKLGLRIIKGTVIGFLVLQFIPGLMSLLVDVGRAIR